MSFARRQLRLRVIDTLMRRARAFRTRHDIWPLRVPPEPVLLDEVIEEALGPDRGDVDEQDVKSRSLLAMEWPAEGGRPPTRWEAWVIALPSGLNLYCDTGDEESRILASGRRDAEGGDVDRFFLELLADSAGAHFGIEMSGGAPGRVRAPSADVEFLVDLFVDLFEITGTERSVHAALGRRAPSDDFRTDVEQWLKQVLR